MEKEEKSYVHVALVLDASGSMASIRNTTVETLKKFFADFASSEDKTILDVWQFDDQVQHIVDGADLAQGAPVALESYTTDGCTALYDAVCKGIDELGQKFAAMPEEERPDGVSFAILTDGFENASRDFTAQDVKTRIEHQSSKYSWRFQFLAANQDAITAGTGLGIDAGSCAQFQSSHAGMRHMCAPTSAWSLALTESREIARKMRAARLSSRKHGSIELSNAGKKPKKSKKQG